MSWVLSPVFFRQLVRVTIFAGVCLSATSVHARIKSERLLAAILQQTPESVLVLGGGQWKQAEQAAAGIPGAMAFFGAGASMEPLFTHGTAIVVAPIAFRDLKKGMTVVYVSSSGRMVAHPITGDVPKGWIAQGMNNDEEDDDLVTKENIVGVVVQAFSEMPSSFRVALTNELVAKGRLSPGRS
ncbi:MAG: hypothetical protein Q7S40_05090 [Opitutaceae bacterium]|nr:hypothetical protein [Opitutaceae bacterium]